jgi:hypothetical protein
MAIAWLEHRAMCLSKWESGDHEHLITHQELL